MPVVKTSFYTEYTNEKGETHREDGPAIEWDNGFKEWYQNDKYHRLDGPACEYTDGTKYWYYQGEKCKSQEEFERIIRLKCLW